MPDPTNPTPATLTGADLDALQERWDRAQFDPPLKYEEETIFDAGDNNVANVCGRVVEQVRNGYLLVEAANALPALLALARKGLEAEGVTAAFRCLDAIYCSEQDLGDPPVSTPSWVLAAREGRGADAARFIAAEVADGKAIKYVPFRYAYADEAAFRDAVAARRDAEDAHESAESKLAAALAEVERLRGRLEKADTFSWRGADGHEWEIHTFARRNAQERAGATWNVCKGIRLHAHAVTFEEAWRAAEAQAARDATKGGPS